MPSEVKLRLELVNVYGKFIQEKVDVLLRNLLLGDVLKASASATGPIDIAGLQGAPQGQHRIEVDPPSYQYLSLFIGLKASGITPLRLVFPVDPSKVKEVVFPTFPKLADDARRLLENSDKILSFEGKKGTALYGALDDIRKAGFLNIITKTNATLLTSGASVLSHIQELQELRGDRFFAVVPKALREETKNSVAAGLFHPADSSLHHPPAGFTHAGSFKTPDHYGNLQLTFFMKGNDCVADIDIDDAAGLEHVFQVLTNKLSGQPTHPYNIHEILVGYQHLDPGYTFKL